MNFLRHLSTVALVLVLVGWVVGHQLAYVLDPTESAILVQLGKPVGEPKTEPGLYFKLPFIQTVLRFERRLLDYDTEPKSVITKDKKALMIDYYAKWRIEKPLLFFTSVRDVRGAISRLDDIIYSELRVEFGSHLLHEIVSTARHEIMRKVTARSDKQLRQFGIEVRDVRIKRADLPQENEDSVFKRMIAERQREAKKYRSEGEMEANVIRAQADRQRTVTLADAQRREREIMGAGDKEAIEIYANAYNADPEFFEFSRSLDAYRKALRRELTIYLTPRSTFFRHLEAAPKAP